MDDIASMPAGIAAACARISAALAADARFVALLIAGSALTDSMDAQSDLDFVVVCRDEDYAGVLQSRREIAASLGELLAAFSGEHVGEPRLLVCLYADPLLHVDLKFVTAAMLAVRVEEPRIVWSRSAEVAARLADGSGHWPNRSAEWFEERFWIWLHYGAAKLRRGEWFAARAMLSYLREEVLGPMIARARGQNQRGVRHIEQDDAWTPALLRTLAGHDAAELAAALVAAADVYRCLRDAHAPPQNHSAACEQQVLAYLAHTAHGAI